MYIYDLSDFLKSTGSGRGKRNNKAIIFNHYLTRLCALAKSCINWTGGLPSEIPEMKLEEYLLFNGQCVFFKDDIAGEYIVLPAVTTGTLNKYGLPNKVKAYGIGYNYDVDLSKGEGVLVWDNYNQRPIVYDLVIFAQRMADTLITTDVNLAQQRIPILFKTTRQGKATIDRAMQAQDAGAYACAVDQTLQSDIAEPMYQPIPYIADKLQEELEKIWAEALTFIGIVNVDEKAERLNSFEVGSQIEEVVAQLNTRLKPRREACQKINELFALDLDCIPASWALTRDRKDTIDGGPGETTGDPEDPEEVNVNEEA